MARSRRLRRSQVNLIIFRVLIPNKIGSQLLARFAKTSDIDLRLSILGEKKEAAGEAAPVAAVQKARKVQKKVVKGVHGTRVKKVGSCY